MVHRTGCKFILQSEKWTLAVSGQKKKMETNYQDARILF